MKVTLQNTEKIVTLNGVPARIWEGETDTGIKVHAFITRIAVGKNENAEQFERELLEVKPPSVEVGNAYPLRMII